MQTTLAYAPTPQDLDEYMFSAPILVRPVHDDDEEPEQGEP